MHPFFKNTRFKFTPSGEDAYELLHAPIGYKQLEQDIQRSKTSDGIVLNRVQNLEFVKEDRDWLVLKQEEVGAGGTIKITGEKKEVFDYVENNSGYLDLSTLSYNKNTAKCDFTDTKFDEELRNLSREEFELDRTTDVNGVAIDSLTRSLMGWKPRQIFLRSELNEIAYTEAFVSDVTITPKSDAKPVSDEDVFSVHDPYVVDPIGAADVYSSNCFMYNSSRDKLLNLAFDVDISVTAYTQCQLHIYRYNNGTSLDYVERIQLGSSFTTSGNDVTYTGEYEIEVSEGDSLMFGMEVTLGSPSYTVTVNTFNLVITEDSFYEASDPDDRQIEVITIKQAFERITAIMDSTVSFESDFIDTYWPSLVISSGETIRHVLYDDTKPTIATTSFDELFAFLFTISASSEGVPPPTFFLEKDGTADVLRIESLSYVFDSSEQTMDLGVLENIEYMVNPDKIYSGVKVGYNRSGENEEVFGLQATHTVNTYKLPISNVDNLYDATCDYRTDPNEAELCYRKQYSQYPDTDTRYDKDIFAFDCYLSGGFYYPYGWDEHFDAVDGIYSPDTAYNYRLSPVNCLVRHSSNFMQEFVKSAYSGRSIVYQSTNGNAELTTTISGGSARAENGDILLSVLDDPLYEPLLIEGEAEATDAIVAQLNGGYPKKNYYGVGVFKDDTGQTSEAYLVSASVGDEVKLELLKKR